jgi:hypothetical protein
MNVSELSRLAQAQPFRYGPERFQPSLPIVPCVYLMLVGLETKPLATI